MNVVFFLFKVAEVMWTYVVASQPMFYSMTPEERCMSWTSSMRVYGDPLEQKSARLCHAKRTKHSDVLSMLAKEISGVNGPKNNLSTFGLEGN